MIFRRPRPRMVSALFPDGEWGRTLTLSPLPPEREPDPTRVAAGPEGLRSDGNGTGEGRAAA